MTLMSPYVMYIAAEELHWSGVMSVVSGGLFLSNRAHSFLDYRSRMQAYGVWSTLIFMLNGLVVHPDRHGNCRSSPSQRVSEPALSA